MLSRIRLRFCFFFQAEDGIRDIGVTGVQTCALPILPSTVIGGGIGVALTVLGTNALLAASPHNLLDLPSVSIDLRSEERRVGKSVDLGGCRIIKKKNTREEVRGTTLRVGARVAQHQD